uniref:Uncharacterized protein n=1 Tax=Aureoumbra lagunensis TaxID=44058 RepID=A0A7S3NJ29_9STRA|mmetsp:Transcript_14588/g.21997  ORF Transcript_14588/g.21997 Transcript_14588/m.21997 type:complete len:667 (+) Transcript_14588:12-2012(+)
MEQELGVFAGLDTIDTNTHGAIIGFLWLSMISVMREQNEACDEATIINLISKRCDEAGLAPDPNENDEVGLGFRATIPIVLGIARSLGIIKSIYKKNATIIENDDVPKIKKDMKKIAARSLTSLSGNISQEAKSLAENCQFEEILEKYDQTTQQAAMTWVWNISQTLPLNEKLFHLAREGRFDEIENKAGPLAKRLLLEWCDLKYNDWRTLRDARTKNLDQRQIRTIRNALDRLGKPLVCVLSAATTDICALPRCALSIRSWQRRKAVFQQLNHESDPWRRDLAAREAELYASNDNIFHVLVSESAHDDSDQQEELFMLDEQVLDQISTQEEDAQINCTQQNTQDIITTRFLKRAGLCDLSAQLARFKKKRARKFASCVSASAESSVQSAEKHEDICSDDSSGGGAFSEMHTPASTREIESRDYRDKQLLELRDIVTYDYNTAYTNAVNGDIQPPPSNIIGPIAADILRRAAKRPRYTGRAQQAPSARRNRGLASEEGSALAPMVNIQDECARLGARTMPVPWTHVLSAIDASPMITANEIRSPCPVRQSAPPPPLELPPANLVSVSASFESARSDTSVLQCNPKITQEHKLFTKQVPAPAVRQLHAPYEDKTAISSPKKKKNLANPGGILDADIMLSRHQSVLQNMKARIDSLIKQGGQQNEHAP